MNIRALINNITGSIETTSNLGNAVKKLRWLYNRSGNAKTQIRFKFTAPVGKIDLVVRDNGGADAFIVGEVFEQQCYHLPLARQTAHIIDLGANAGFTAVYLSKLFPDATIACVEPMPGNIELLRENLALNKVKALIFEAAATVNNQPVVMEVADKDYANKVHNIPYGKTFSKNTLTVEGMSIDTMLSKLNWQQVDLLKIDIEGYEGILLSTNNNWLERVAVIIMEIHEGVTIEFIKSITAPYGFTQVNLQLGNWVLSKDKLF
ncbi:MAG: FkbM family methyltransferase [Bacteroidota bacterium]